MGLEVPGQVARMAEQLMDLSQRRERGWRYAPWRPPSRRGGRHVTGQRNDVGCRRPGPSLVRLAAACTRQARATPTESTHSTPRAMTQCSLESVPMPKVWARATGHEP